jgi:hypothetical protein
MEEIMSDDIDRLLESFPEGWRPSPGDKLIGIVIGLQTRAGDYGDYPIVIVRTDEGEDFAFHAFHTVARGELEKLQLREGDRIGIAYHGPHPQRRYERYRIVLVRRSGEPGSDSPPSADSPPPDQGMGPDGAAAPDQQEDAGDGQGDGVPF